MGKYIKSVNTHQDYEEDFPKLYPNVAYCINEKEVHYLDSGMIIVTKYNVTSTTEPTQLFQVSSSYLSDDELPSIDEDIRSKKTKPLNIKYTEIDGTKLPVNVTAYTFDTTGEHTVKYYLMEDYDSKYTVPSFEGNTNLKYINIPEGVTKINMKTFKDCNINTVILPDTIEEIKAEAFLGRIDTIILYSTTPPTLPSNHAVFNPDKRFNLVIPEEALSIYSTTIPWSTFNLQTEP